MSWGHIFPPAGHSTHGPGVTAISGHLSHDAASGHSWGPRDRDGDLASSLGPCLWSRLPPHHQFREVFMESAEHQQTSDSVSVHSAQPTLSLRLVNVAPSISGSMVTSFPTAVTHLCTASLGHQRRNSVLGPGWGAELHKEHRS